MNSRFELLKDDYIDYELDGETYRLYRIRAKKDFYNSVASRVIHEGDLGGYVAHEMDLKEDDESWVFDNGKLIGSLVSRLSSSAILGNAVVRYSRLYDCVVTNDAYVHNSTIQKDSWIGGFAIVRNGFFNKKVTISGFCEINNTTSNSELYLSENVVITDCYFGLSEQYKIRGNIVISSDNSKILRLTDSENIITIIKTTDGQLLWNKSAYGNEYTPMPEDNLLYQYAKENL